MLRFKEKNNNWFNAGLIIATFIISIMTVLGGSNLNVGDNISVGKISSKKYIAPRTIENTVETQRLRQQAYNSVPDREKRDTDVDEKMKKNLNSFFNSVDIEREKYKEFLEKSRSSGTTSENTGATEETPSAPPKIYNLPTLPIYLMDRETQMLLDFSDDNYELFKTNVELVLESAIEHGIKEDSRDINEFIKLEMEKYYFDTSMRTLGYDVTNAFTEPNIVIDREKTEQLRQQEADEVKPVYYLKGQTIVDKGGYIDEEIYAMLDSLGYTQKDFKEIIWFIIGCIIMVGLSVFPIIYYINKDKAVKTESQRNRFLLFTIYNLCIISVWILRSVPAYFIPILIFTMLSAIIVNVNFSIVMNVVFSVMAYLIANLSYEYFIYFLISGSILALVSNKVSERSQIITIGLLTSCINAVVLFGILLVQRRDYSAEILNQAFYAFFNGIFTVIIAIGSLPFWETAFGVMTPIKLLDLTNPNNPLLRRLTIEAPGTYHHSLIVANLAEAAAIDIGANPAIARVGGYYHDIGKLKYPQYFSENQLGDNPHDKMKPLDSAIVIKNHVSYGLELAEEYNLPTVIKDMISTHHGTTLIKYFYYKAKKEEPDAEINESDFRYPYSIPAYKETAIVMLADTVEAAIRSMIPSGKTIEEVEEFTKKLINDKLDDRQLQDSKLTMSDLDIIAKTFVRVFKGMYHERISYPGTEDVKDKSNLVKLEKQKE